MFLLLNCFGRKLGAKLSVQYKVTVNNSSKIFNIKLFNK